jgi:hypothetical protein
MWLNRSCAAQRLIVGFFTSAFGVSISVQSIFPPGIIPLLVGTRTSNTVVSLAHPQANLAAASQIPTLFHGFGDTEEVELLSRYVMHIGELEIEELVTMF